MKIAIVLAPAPRSLSIITSLRFQRSTSAPATGPNTSTGAKLKNATSASAVAEPVSWYAQIVRANCVIAVPSSEATCPAQTIINARIPVGLPII